MDSQQPIEKPVAVEPQFPPLHCRNCGREVHHHYCAHCGQHRADHNKNLGFFLREFWGEFVQVDSKFLRTIVPLCFKPGFLTREWIAGKRVRYITPLKLYVTISAVCFLIISYQYSQNVKFNAHDNSTKTENLANVNIGGTNILDFSSDIENAKKMDAKAKTKKSKGDSFFEGLFSGVAKPGPEGDANRKDFVDKLVGRLSTANLLLLPVFALLFKLLYIRRSRYYVEHLVFALHYYAFTFLGLSICLLVKTPWVIAPVSIWMTLYLPIAMYLHYQQGVIKTFVKCVTFGFMYTIAVSFALVGLVIVTAIDTGHLDSAAIKNAAKQAEAESKVKNPPGQPSASTPSSVPSTTGSLSTPSSTPPSTH